MDTEVYGHLDYLAGHLRGASFKAEFNEEQFKEFLTLDESGKKEMLMDYGDLVNVDYEVDDYGEIYQMDYPTEGVK
ncbi:MAG: hypothetical protein JKY50_00225 [Oleispira sp.]|nr:hypothetical protein [Oleispira sp.]